MRNSGLKRLAWLAVVVGALTASPAAKAQRYVTLVDWDQSWQYVEQFGVNLGTAWRTNTYNDAVAPWQTGQGIFANETAAYPATFLTTLSFGPQPQVNNTTNYYFRTHFTFYASNFIAPLGLWASNAVDDGCVVYLNGMEAGRIRVPANQTAATYASGTIPFAEGTIEPFSINTNLLRIGDNVLAVEVHQVNATSSDIAFGLKLAAIVPTAISITTQPISQTVAQGSSVNLTVTTTGGPGTFQWQTNNGAGVWVNIAGATSTNYGFVASVFGTTSYRFVASNGVGTAISAVATVTVAQDTFGPMILSACVLEEPTRTNRIELSFNENLFSFGTTSTVASTISPPILTNNFRLVMSGSNVVVPLASSTYTPAVAPSTTSRVTLTVAANAFGTNNWFHRGDYYLLLNNIRDVRTNVIAPNSIVGLCWPNSTNVLSPTNIIAGQTWYWHSSWFFERYPDFVNPTGPDVYTSAWASVTYTGHLDEGTYWGTTVNPRMVFDLSSVGICYTNAPTEGIGFQVNPTLFRTTFMWPTNESMSTNVDLTFNYGGDDGVAMFLNGVFLFKDANFPAGSITDATRTTTATEGACRVITVPRVALLRGSNVLAAAVAQFNTEGDSGFVCSLDAKTFSISPLPATGIGTNAPGFVWSRTNRLTMTKLTPSSSPTNLFTVNWPTNAYGFVLERATNILGPWNQVQPQMANPYITNATGGPRYFYRLEATQ